MRTIRTPENEAEFLEALRETGGNVTRACGIAGVSRTAVYDWREEDPGFGERWEQALEIGTDALEDEALRRAHDGVDRPVFYKGAECGHVREYSDTLLIFMLKARRPERFKDRAATEISGPGGGALVIERRIVDPGAPTHPSAQPTTSED